MRNILPLITLAILVSCSAPKESTTTYTTTSINQAMEPADSIVYYKTTIDFEQKDMLPQMLGDWSLASMQRQARLPLETLNSVSISLKPGGVIHANSSCGSFNGNYSVKGMSVKFSNLKSSWSNCSNTEQMNEMLRLLQNTVSMYTIEGNTMTFRDNSSNIVFTARKG